MSLQMTCRLCYELFENTKVRTRFAGQFLYGEIACAEHSAEGMPIHLL